MFSDALQRLLAGSGDTEVVLHDADDASRPAGAFDVAIVTAPRQAHASLVIELSETDGQHAVVTGGHEEDRITIDLRDVTDVILLLDQLAH